MSMFAFELGAEVIVGFRCSNRIYSSFARIFASGWGDKVFCFGIFTSCRLFSIPGIPAVLGIIP